MKEIDIENGIELFDHTITFIFHLILLLMLLHLGLDRVMLCSSIGQVILPFEAIDASLSELFIDTYQKTQPNVIYVITGPGSFTNVRVGVLVIDVLMMILGGSCRIMHIDKISLYQSLRSDGFLPSSILMYIGQRKNLWHYDFAYSNDYKLLHGEEALLLRQGESARDIVLASDSFFDQKKDHSIGRGWSDDAPYVFYRDKSIDCASFFHHTEKLESFYTMIEGVKG